MMMLRCERSVGQYLFSSLLQAGAECCCGPAPSTAWP